METNVKTRGEGENVRILSTGNQGRTFNKLLGGGGGRSGRYTIAQKYANAWVVSSRVVLIFDILPTNSALVGSHLLTGLNNSDPLLTMLGLTAENPGPTLDTLSRKLGPTFCDFRTVTGGGGGR